MFWAISAFLDSIFIVATKPTGFFHLFISLHTALSKIGVFLFSTLYTRCLRPSLDETLDVCVKTIEGNVADRRALPRGAHLTAASSKAVCRCVGGQWRTVRTHSWSHVLLSDCVLLSAAVLSVQRSQLLSLDVNECFESLLVWGVTDS